MLPKQSLRICGSALGALLCCHHWLCYSRNTGTKNRFLSDAQARKNFDQDVHQKLNYLLYNYGKDGKLCTKDGPVQIAPLLDKGTQFQSGTHFCA